MYDYTVEPLYVQKANELIAADLYLPVKVKRPPVLIMAHGFAGLRQFKLIQYAQRFAQAGFAVVLFDYRCWGGSTGKPREMVSVRQQLEDWYAVIAHIKLFPLVDGHHLFLWGTGLSGGYVLKLASELNGIRAAIAQVPFVDGNASSKIYPIQHMAQALKLSSQDLMAAKVGRIGKTMPVVHPYALSFYPSQDSYQGYMSIVDSNYYWSGEVPARAMLDIIRFRPITTARSIKIPVLFIAAKKDAIIPIEISRETATNMAPYVEYHEWNMTHFDIYQANWMESAIKLQLEFLDQNRGVNS